MAKSQETTEIRNPYSIKTDNGEVVDTYTANPNRTIQIHGHRIKIKDIPITAARLDCGHTVRGIAFSPGNLVYCEKHGDKTLVPSVVVDLM